MKAKRAILSVCSNVSLPDCTKILHRKIQSANMFVSSDVGTNKEYSQSIQEMVDNWEMQIVWSIYFLIHEHKTVNFYVLLTVHLDTIKVLFANLMHNFFIKSIIFLYSFEHCCAHHQEDLIVYMHHLVPDIITLLRRPSSPNLCAERSPKESDDIRNQMMHIYN